MNFFCFKFWLVWRFTMACLAHFNWFTAFYMNCIYFSLWKFYDILWFWMHLILCICFKPLRSENFLFVLFNLIISKQKRYQNKTYQQIFNCLYNQRFTKSERELKRIEKFEKDEFNSNLEDELNISEDDDFDNKNNFFKNNKKQVCLYPSLKIDEKIAMLNINVNQAVPKLYNEITEHEDLLGDSDSKKDCTNSVITESSNFTKQGLLKKVSKQFIPVFLKKSAGVNNQSSSFTSEEKKMIVNEKLRLKKEKQLQKVKQKEINERRKLQLRVLAASERRRKNLSSAIDLLLTWLRLMTTFAILVGHIHKTFLPKFLVAPDDNIYEHPDLLMIFTITISLDILFFWFMMFWTYCKQFRLCCRLGVFYFWLWLMALAFFGIICMYGPMHFVHNQLDMTWCSFKPETPLSYFLEGNFELLF